MANYVWTLPIGDWSGDGHGHCEWFLIHSNYPVEKAREAYFKATEESGITISDEFGVDEYKIDWKVPESFLKELLAKGYVEKTPDYRKNSEEWYELASWESLVEIILYFIQKYNPDFEYSFEAIDKIMFPFYGSDYKKRHINDFGYGLFDY